MIVTSFIISIPYVFWIHRNYKRETAEGTSRLIVNCTLILGFVLTVYGIIKNDIALITCSALAIVYSIILIFQLMPRRREKKYISERNISSKKERKDWWI